MEVGALWTMRSVVERSQSAWVKLPHNTSLGYTDQGQGSKARMQPKKPRGQTTPKTDLQAQAGEVKWVAVGRTSTVMLQ